MFRADSDSLPHLVSVPEQTWGLLGNIGLPAFQGESQSEPKNGDSAIVRLTSSLIRFSSDSRRKKGDDNRRLDFVSMLTAGPGPSSSLDFALLEKLLHVPTRWMGRR